MKKVWIKRETYEYLRVCEEMKTKLEDEVKRLSELISSQNPDCKVGPWCKDCAHIGRDSSEVHYYTPSIEFGCAKTVAGEVIYCKKHIHDMCPEFEKPSSGSYFSLLYK